MSQQIQICLPDSDVNATAGLLEDEAPNASDLLWSILKTPLTARAVHAIYAGPAVLVSIPERHGEPRGGQIPVENETERPRPGNVLLLPPAEDGDEDIWGEPGGEPGVTLAIFYGDQGRPFTPSGWQPGVVVAHVTEGLDDLREACRKVRFEGRQRISVARDVSGGEVPEVVISSDGASLGNPGPAGAGFVITTPDGRLVHEGAIPLEPATVNVAEYRALIGGLLEARKLGARRVKAYMDSQLVVRQLTGEYRVKARGLRPLHKWASDIISDFESFVCEHVPREENEQADELAGQAARRSKEQQGTNGA